MLEVNQLKMDFLSSYEIRFFKLADLMREAGFSA
jgi:hypothetical protein